MVTGRSRILVNDDRTERLRFAGEDDAMNEGCVGVCPDVPGVPFSASEEDSWDYWMVALRSGYYQED